MEKETYISKVEEKNISLDEKLKFLSDILYKELKVKVNFCKIIRKRWSNFAGEDILSPHIKVKLADNYGMIIQEKHCLDLENLKENINYLISQK